MLIGLVVCGVVLLLMLLFVVDGLLPIIYKYSAKMIYIQIIPSISRTSIDATKFWIYLGKENLNMLK